MGMGAARQQRWATLNTRHLTDQLKASDAVGGIGTVSKVLRLLLQSAMLGLGAYLVIKGELSAGAIIASSIIMSRALAPIDIAIAHWRGFVSARHSHAPAGRAVSHASAPTSGKLLAAAGAAHQRLVENAHRGAARGRAAGRCRSQLRAGRRRRARHHRPERHRASRRWRARSSAPGSRCAAAACGSTARRSTSGTPAARPPRRLPAAGRRAVRRHGRGEHRALRPTRHRAPPSSRRRERPACTT